MDFDASTAKPVNDTPGGFDPSTATPEKPTSAARRVGDVGISVAKGIIGVPEAAVGVADLVTGGKAGKYAEAAGFRPREAKAVLDAGFSTAQQDANEHVARAEGFFPTIGAMVSNPSTIVNAVAESAPSMLGGGAVARGALALAPRLGAVAAGALGEGVVSAGQNAEQVRQEDPNGELTAGQAGILGASGFATGALSLGAGRIANRLGIGDVSTMLAAGKTGPVGARAAAAGAPKGFARKVAEGVAVEGALQELPQSAQEQAAQNIAQGKPWDEGVSKAAAQGFLVGGVMGAGAAPLGGKEPAAAAPAAPQPGTLAHAATLALPAPVVTVGPDGTAMTAADRMSEKGVVKEKGAVGQGRNSDPAPLGLPAPAGVPALGYDTSETGTLIASPDGAVRTESRAEAINRAQREEEKRQAADAEAQRKTSLGIGKPRARPSPAADTPAASAPALPFDNRPTGTLIAGQDGVREERRPEAVRRAQDAADAIRRDEAERVRRAELGLPQDTATPGGDILNDGKPFKSPFQATQAARRAGKGYRVQRVDGGFVARKSEDITDVQAKPATPATEPPSVQEKAPSTTQPQAEAPRGQAPVAAAPAAPGRTAAGAAARTGAVEADGLSQAAAPAIEEAAHAAATSPRNDLPEPTDAQKEAGNYRKGHLNYEGLDLSIENPVGSTRSGVDPGGKPWTVPMTAHYGYLKRSTGGDGEQVDVYLAANPRAGAPVFVVDQYRADGKFDEHKAVAGVATEAEATALYDAHFSDGSGPRRRRGVKQMTVDEFKTWARSDAARGPAAPDVTPNAAQQRREFAAAERARKAPGNAARARAHEANPFKAFIGKHGIALSIAGDFAPGPKERRAALVPGYGPVFRKAGLPLDQLAERAVQEGFLVEPDEARLHGLIIDALRGKRIIAQYAEGVAEDEMLARIAAAEVDAQQLPVDILESLDDDIPWGDTAESNISTEDAMRALGFTDQEIENATANRTEGTGQDRQGGGEPDEAAARATQGSDAQGARAPRPATEGLTSPTQQDVLDQQARATAGEKAEVAARAAEEQRARADAERGEFTLTGSDRPSDVAAAAGQADIFAPPPPAPTSSPAPAPAPAADSAPKITDFGEKLEGARKDYAAQLKDAIAKDVAAVPLSESWPEPNYAKLLDTGTDPWTVAFVHAARDSIPTKPQKSWKLSQWADSVRNVRDLADKLLSGTWARDAVEPFITEGQGTLARFITTVELYQQLGHDASLKGIEVSSGSYSVYKGQRYQPAKRIWTVERKAKGGTFGNWPNILAEGDTREAAIAAFVAKVKAAPEAAAAPSARAASFDIWREAGKYHVGKKIGKEYASFKKLDTIAEARAYLADNKPELEAALERYRSTPFERKEQNAPRVGADHRGGARVTPEVFAEAFGFRGVQFGNYVENSKRQQDLNDAYDSLMDLAAVLGVPPRALSLDGQLGLAFGARGQGGKNPAAAHYEPSKVVINLTKNNGAGSLAHEWFHAVDNYFAKTGSDKPSEGMMTDGVKNAAVREEMGKAFDGINAAIKSTGMRQRSRQLDARRSKAYWSSGFEMSARAFESYIVAKLQDQGATNDYLANVVDPAVWQAMDALLGHTGESYPYPLEAEMGAVREAFDHFFNTVQTKETPRGIALMALDFDAKAFRDFFAPPKGMTVQGAQAVVDRLTADWKSGPRVKVVATARDLPRQVDLRARGLYTSDSGIYIVAGNNMSADWVARTLAHEAIAHYGLRQALGEAGWVQLMGNINQGIKSGNKALTDIHEYVQRAYQGEKLRPSQIADEVAARAVELAVDPVTGKFRPGLEFLKLTFARIARWLRGLGIDVPFTLTELHGMLVGAVQSLQAGQRMQGGGEMVVAAARSDNPVSLPPVIIGSTLGSATSHPDYADAKAGKTLPAVRVAKALVTDDLAARVQAALGDRKPIVVPVLSEEATGRNRLPNAAALVLANKLGLQATATIVQENRPRRTTLDGLDRIFAGPSFMGPVEPGRSYLLVDDTLTQGATFAALASHIEDNGGIVVGAVALTGKQYSATLAPNPETLAALRDKHGDLESDFRAATGYGFDALTQSEARYLASYQPADAVRTRIVEEGQRARDGRDEGDDRGGPDVALALGIPAGADPVTSSMGDMTAAQEAAWRRAAHLSKPPTLRERADALRANLGMRITQGLVDQFRPIKDVSQEAYMLARMSKGSDGTMEAALLYGKPFLRDGVADVNVADGGFAKVLASLKGEHDRFLWWVAAQRAERLKAEGKENLLSVGDIAELKTLNGGAMRDGTARAPLYAQALKQLNDFNEAVLLVARDSGLIDQAAVDLFRSQPYVPFYRVMEDGAEGMSGPRFSSGLTNQQAFKKLKGGTDQLNSDLLQNTLMNWSHLYAAAARNRAATSTMDAAANLAVAHQVPEGTKGSVKVMRGGVAEHWAVEDPYLLEAISAISYSPSPLMKPLAMAKQLLTLGVTINPSFKIKNLIRDSLSAMAQADLSYNPLENVAKGWKATARDSQTTASMLASGGTIRFGTQENTARIRDQIARLGDTVLNENGWTKLRGQLRSLYDAYSEFGDRSENVNRAALYERLLVKGHTHAEASFMARDLMDFSMSGRWPLVRFLTQTVPFMNARLQGLYKLGRAASEDPRRFGTMALAVAMASMGLMAAYQDDDDWKRREDWDRDSNWWFKIGETAYRIPKPFEVGSIGTIAERTAELMFDDEMTGGRFTQRMWAMVGQTFAMDPTPQIIKPMLDVYANRDSFTGRAIESQADQRLRPEDRYSENTSEVARLLGSLGLPNPVKLLKADYDPLSPKQFDSLIRGYFSWMGVVATGGIDSALRPAMGRGERPEMRLRDTFIVGNFAESLPSGSSRYVSTMYEQAREVELAYASYRDALKRGDKGQAAEILREDGAKISRRAAYNAATRALSEINQQAKQVEANVAMPAALKRERLDALNQRREQAAERVARVQPASA